MNDGIKTENPEDVMTFSDLVGPTFDSIDARQGRAAPVDVVPTGFQDLDRLTRRGLPLGSTTAVFGHTGVGSSALALGFAAFAAIDLEDSIPALVVSWESNQEALMYRILARTGQVPHTRMVSGGMDDGDWGKLAAVMRRAGEPPLALAAGPTSFKALEKYVDDWIEASSNRRRLLVLDGLPHLARLAPAGPDTSVWDAHTRITAQVKHLALSRQIAIVYTVPTVVEVLRRHDNTPPKLGDVAYSPAYVTDADLVLGIHRPDLIERESPRAGEADLCVLKHKNGITGTVTVAWQGHYQRFVDMRI